MQASAPWVSSKAALFISLFLEGVWADWRDQSPWKNGGRGSLTPIIKCISDKQIVNKHRCQFSEGKLTEWLTAEGWVGPGALCWLPDGL